MPDGKAVAGRDRASLVAIDLYFDNPRVRSHGEKVRIELVKSIGCAPVKNFPQWVDQGRHQAKKSALGRHGRPMTWGQWYMFTFPDWSNLSKREKVFYENRLLRGLDRGAVGKRVWHNKRLFNTHDLNLLVAPFYVSGNQLGTRRDRDHSEFRRLQRVSDRALEQINRRRRALRKPLIPTMPQIQARKRLKKQRQTVAAALAESLAFTKFLYTVSHPQSGREQLKEAMARGLREAGFATNAKTWSANWRAKIQAPGLRQPQSFCMVNIAGEALDLRRQRELAKHPPTKAAPATARPPRLQAPPAKVMPAAPREESRSQPSPMVLPPTPSPHMRPSRVTGIEPPTPPLRLTPQNVINWMLFRSGSKGIFLRDLADLETRLRQGGFTSQNREDGQLLIADERGQQLEVDTYGFIVRCQRTILTKPIYGSPLDSIGSAEVPDFTPHNRKDQKAAQWMFPAFGDFWERAREECADVISPAAWRKHVRITAKIPNTNDRLRKLRSGLRREGLSPWKIFLFLQAHCGDAEFVSPWLLGKGGEAGVEFQKHQQLLTPIGCETPAKVRHAQRGLIH